MLSTTEVTIDTVGASIKEFEFLGRDVFLLKYGFRKATSYYIRKDGKYYDSKAIAGVARKYAESGISPHQYSDFSGGAATVVKHLETLGFVVELLDGERKKEVDAFWKSNSPAYWWVNHKQTAKQEVGGNYLWSPITKKNGGKSEFYDNMQRARPGDIIFSFADAKIGAIGICSGNAKTIEKPSEFGAAGDGWHNEGWLLPVEFSLLPKKIKIKKYAKEISPLLPEKYSPIRSDGSGNQGAYLASIPQEMASTLITIMEREGNKVEVVRPSIQLNPDITGHQQEFSDTAEILNRTDLDSTQKEQMIQARRGHGIYRSNLERFERGCRVTGVVNKRHLRASHIKPWSLSTDAERLDGNNGLLLSPHIDHLFDRGFISFSDEGKMIVSLQLDPSILLAWNVDESKEVTPFRKEQVTYLSYHREHVLQK
jgi:putative restriction endonuclease